MFDDEFLEFFKLIYGGGKGKGCNIKIVLGLGFFEEMKVVIIVRVEVFDFDEEDCEEWDLFVERNGMDRLEVGFEEELDEEED